MSEMKVKDDGKKVSMKGSENVHKWDGECFLNVQHIGGHWNSFEFVLVNPRKQNKGKLLQHLLYDGNNRAYSYFHQYYAGKLISGEVEYDRVTLCSVWTAGFSNKKDIFYVDTPRDGTAYKLRSFDSNGKKL